MSYSNTNKQTQRGLCIVYTYAYDSVAQVYCITRVCTKDYGYYGLTESDAKTCANDKITKYTRVTKGWIYDKTNGWHYENCTRCQAQICPVHDAGHLWHTEIRVNERDDVYRGGLPADLSSVFDIQNDYDE